jgi:hypothetical protein
VNAYQQQYPPFPEMAKTKKSVSHMQCQTDSSIMAALSDNWETRQKLQMALEHLGDCTDHQAEVIAAEERETALKIFSEQEVLRLESLKPAAIKQWRPLHLPPSHVDHEPKSNKPGHQSREALQKLKEHIVQRDSVTRLRNMLNLSHNEASGWNDKKPPETLAHTSTRKLPKRVFDSLREPPKLIPQESLISLAEKLRFLDVASASEKDFLDFPEESTGESLHQKLKQLPAVVKNEKQQVTATGTTYSLSHSLQSWERNGSNL